MFFFWIVFFIAAFVGSIALVFYLTIELNEVEKKVMEMAEDIKGEYGLPNDKK
ncbi:MAG: hypothetical protein LBU70_00995 [Chitinispirillales bacterium]|nr:hypothetical protein [Chitinispirillales bacterium]